MQRSHGEPLLHFIFRRVHSTSQSMRWSTIKLRSTCLDRLAGGAERPVARLVGDVRSSTSRHLVAFFSLQVVTSDQNCSNKIQDSICVLKRAAGHTVFIKPLYQSAIRHKPVSVRTVSPGNCVMLNASGRIRNSVLLDSCR